MDLTLVYGILVGLGLFLAAWFLFVVPSEKRDHERRLEIVRKRLAEKEEREQWVPEDDDDDRDD